MAVSLREMREPDLAIFFRQQGDPVACHMAAFTAEDPADYDAFLAKWSGILQDERIIKRTILCDGRVAGSILRFDMIGEPEVSYWIGREFWGRGVATRALALFLEVVQERPLFGRSAKDNLGSIRVMEKNGFQIIGEGRGYANARGQETGEYILKLV